MKYIAIEGIIGAGKTTLATLLAAQVGGKIVLEEYASNPYLADFYRNPSGKAFHLEMSFLAARRLQLLKELKEDHHILVADYYFPKTLLFASETLTQPEFTVFKEFYQLASGDIREPDVLIFIDTPPDIALKNILHRGRPYEAHISEKYLERLYLAYVRLLGELKNSHVIRLPASDVTRNAAFRDLSEVTSLIKGHDINNSL